MSLSVHIPEYSLTYNFSLRVSDCRSPGQLGKRRFGKPLLTMGSELSAEELIDMAGKRD
jgi:hypothetical protein